jgi:hypothetical protein
MPQALKIGIILKTGYTGAYFLPCSYIPVLIKWLRFQVNSTDGDVSDGGDFRF